MTAISFCAPRDSSLRSAYLRDLIDFLAKVANNFRLVTQKIFLQFDSAQWTSRSCLDDALHEAQHEARDKLTSECHCVLPNLDGSGGVVSFGCSFRVLREVHSPCVADSVHVENCLLALVAVYDVVDKFAYARLCIFLSWHEGVDIVYFRCEHAYERRDGCRARGLRVCVNAVNARAHIVARSEQALLESNR